MKCVAQGKIKGKRKRGRPPLSYLKSLGNEADTSLATLFQESEDRTKWRSIVKKTTSLSATISGDDADR